MDKPTERRTQKLNDLETAVEMRKDFGDRIGFAIRGIYDEKGFFHLEHYFPYFTGPMPTGKEEIVINKRVDTDAYTGMCDDLRLGVSLIFYLQNAADYMESGLKDAARIMSVTLSALSTQGEILLGMEKDEGQLQNSSAQAKMRSQLISEAWMGNQEAIDSLTIDDIDTYAMISRRIRKEDVYSIVESSFYPYGSESDNYSILGTILNWRAIRNSYTGEEVCEIFVNCNELTYSVCINREDLMGEPAVGRRFKGNIWMQGKVDFEEV